MAEPQSLGEIERAAIERLDSELADHARLTLDAFELIGQALVLLPEAPIAEVPQSEKVANTLLIRIANDLRCLALVALRGYSVQANTLAASILEIGFTVSFIGDDDDLAQEWVEHAEPTRPFRNVREMITAVIERLNRDDTAELVVHHYRTYSQLCMARHANPLFQMQHGPRLEGDVVVLSPGPDTSEGAVRACWFAMEHAVGVVEIALESFMRSHLNLAGDHGLVTALAALSQERKRLNVAAIERWGDQDPYPGRWRR